MRILATLIILLSIVGAWIIGNKTKKEEPMGKVITRGKFMNQIARMADTKKQKIDVSISYRLTRIVLDELAKMSLKDVAKVLTRA